jgi:hypothetical protein
MIQVLDEFAGLDTIEAIEQAITAPYSRLRQWVPAERITRREP